MYPCGFLPFKAKSLPVSAEKWISSIDSKPLFCLSLTLGRRSLWSRELPMTKHKESSRRWKRSGRISLSASLFFISSLPRCVAKSLELTVQEGIHVDTKKIKINWNLGFRRESVYSSDSFGLVLISSRNCSEKSQLLTKAVNRSNWFWFRYEIALKKPTSNQNGESESCKWSNKEVRKSYHRGFAFRLCFPLLLLFVLAPSSSAISCDYFASDSRAIGDFWLKTIGKSEISRISDEKNRFPQQKSLGFLPQIWLDPAKSQIRSPTAFLRIWRQMILRKNYGSNLA